MNDRTSEQPLNVLLLTVDTLRADMVSSDRNPRGITPVLDRLAEDGLRFDQAITGGSWTQAAFPPLLTSSYASMFGGCLGALAPERPSPIEALAAHGYKTIGISSSPLLGERYAYHRGFKRFHELVPDEADPRLRRIKGGERLLTMPLTHRIAGLFGRRLRPARLYGTADEVNDQLIADLDTGQPFFGWLHYMDVHWPYHLEAELELPAEISQAWIDVKHLYRVNWKNDSISPDQEAHYLHLYQEAVRYTDAQIGRLLSRLDEIGLLKNTAIIVVSDHGEEMLERGKWGHFEVNLHDEILRVPLIIRLPDERATGIIRQQVRTMDIMPTVLELCGCPEPAGMAGRSLAPLWQGIPGHDEDRLSISEMWRDARHIIAVRTEEHKYIWDSRSPEAGELYDLNADPGERINIVHREPELKMRYQGEVDEHLLKVAATNPAVPVEAPELDAAMVRRLRDLGYLE